MILPDYLSDVAKQMRLESDSIRRDFATHHLSAGENRETLVKRFLKSHLPERFGVSNGIVISHNGVFSKQADLVVVDKNNNAPLYSNARNKLWPVESVYALIEVKTNLNPSDLSDRADRELKLAWPSAIRPIGLRDEPIEFDRRRSRSAYQTQSSRPPSGFAPLGRLAR